MTPRMEDSESAPLLHGEHWHGEATDDDHDQERLVAFEEDDDENPKNWPLRWKYFQVLQVTLIGRTLAHPPPPLLPPCPIAPY